MAEDVRRFRAGTPPEKTISTEGELPTRRFRAGIDVREQQALIRGAREEEKERRRQQETERKEQQARIDAQNKIISEKNAKSELYNKAIANLNRSFKRYGIVGSGGKAGKRLKGELRKQFLRERAKLESIRRGYEARGIELIGTRKPETLSYSDLKAETINFKPQITTRTLEGFEQIQQAQKFQAGFGTSTLNLQDVTSGKIPDINTATREQRQAQAGEFERFELSPSFVAGLKKEQFKSFLQTPRVSTFRTLIDPNIYKQVGEFTKPEEVVINEPKFGTLQEGVGSFEKVTAQEFSLRQNALPSGYYQSKNTANVQLAQAGITGLKIGGSLALLPTPAGVPILLSSGVGTALKGVGELRAVKYSPTLEEARSRTIRGAGLVTLGVATATIGISSIAPQIRKIDIQIIQEDLNKLGGKKFKLIDIQTTKDNQGLVTAKLGRNYKGLTQEVQVKGRFVVKEQGKFLFVPEGAGTSITSGKITSTNLIASKDPLRILQAEKFKFTGTSFLVSKTKDSAIAFSKIKLMPQAEGGAFFNNLGDLKKAEKILRADLKLFSTRGATKTFQLTETQLIKTTKGKTKGFTISKVRAKTSAGQEFRGASFQTDFKRFQRISQDNFNILPKGATTSDKKLELNQIVGRLRKKEAGQLVRQTIKINVEGVQPLAITTEPFKKTFDSNTLSKLKFETPTQTKTIQISSLLPQVPAPTIPLQTTTGRTLIGAGLFSLSNLKSTQGSLNLSQQSFKVAQATETQSKTQTRTITQQQRQAQAQKLSFSLKSISKLETRKVIETINVSPAVTTIPTLKPSITPKTITPFGFKFKTPKGKVSGLSKAFSVEVKRGGKFKTIGTGLTKGEALKLGSTNVLNTLSATFRLKGAGVTRKQNRQLFKLPSTIKRKRKQALTFVQVRGSRLSSLGELKEIKYKRGKK